ncbi:hypothetical protein BDA99DRAFT_539426 [Phascolomyces articulosus]|uniref:Uncharacterized protein n=1 Tax=Phascolomyces articulosus TaxID=60185 RepID=A0AAD5PCE9_9FUNG|nr:hypothetical protein BDA99DRAFT_539426 [Phascolomyces articulosus]
MSSSTLDSRWATTTDRKRADEGLPTTQYAAALKINKDLHPETTPSPSPSSPSQLSSTSLGSRWATPYDSYKAERGLPATKYSEILANAQIDLHPQQQSQPSAKWINQGNQMVQKEEQSWWNSPSMNNEYSHQDHRKDGNSNNNRSTASRSPPPPTSNKSTITHTMDPPNCSLWNNNNNTNSYNSNYNSSSYNNNSYNNNGYNKQQVRSQGSYSPSQQQYQRRDTENSWRPSTPVPNQRPQQQPVPRQYEPISSRPWNLIAMKKKEEFTPSSSHTTTPDDGSPQPHLEQPRQENVQDSSASFWNQEVEEDILDTPITSFKSYKEWSEEQRQKSATYTEGNELLVILLKGRNTQNERSLQSNYDNNFGNSNVDNSSASKPLFNHTSSQNEGVNTNEELSNTQLLEWNPEGKKPWDDEPTTIVQQPQQYAVPNNYGNSSPNIPVNYNEQSYTMSPPVKASPSSNLEIQNCAYNEQTTQLHPDTPSRINNGTQGYHRSTVTTSSSQTAASFTWDPNGRKPWDDGPVSQSPYNTVTYSSNYNTQAPSTTDNNNQPAIAPRLSSWNSSQQTHPPLNNNMSNQRAQPLNNNKNVENHTPSPPPVMRSASSSSSGASWDPNAPKPWEEQPPRPSPLNVSQQHQYNNTASQPMVPSPSQYDSQIAEKQAHSNSNVRGIHARKSWGVPTSQQAVENNRSNNQNNTNNYNNWDRSAGSRSIYDVQNSNHSEDKLPAQRQSWQQQNTYNNMGDNRVRSPTGSRPWDVDKYSEGLWEQ